MEKIRIDMFAPTGLYMISPGGYNIWVTKAIIRPPAIAPITKLAICLTEFNNTGTFAFKELDGKLFKKGFFMGEGVLNIPYYECKSSMVNEKRCLILHGHTTIVTVQDQKGVIFEYVVEVDDQMFYEYPDLCENWSLCVPSISDFPVFSNCSVDISAKTKRSSVKR